MQPRAVVVDRIPLHGIAHAFHIDFSPDGAWRDDRLPSQELGHACSPRHGGAFEDTITLFWRRPRQNRRSASRRVGTLCFPAVRRCDRSDKSRIYISAAARNLVTVIDLPRLMQYIRLHPGGFAHDLPPARTMFVTRIPVGLNPRGITLSRDGRGSLSPTVSTTRSALSIRTRTRWFPQSVSKARRMYPRYATVSRPSTTSRYSFQGQIGCANCHIDSTFDGLTWNLEPDGFGRNPVDNKLIEGIKDTEPYKWTGTNPDIPTECGPRTEKYFWRSEQYDDITLTDLSLYVRSLNRGPTAGS